MPAGVTDAAVTCLAGAVRPEVPDESCEIRQMCDGDLRAGRQVRQAICRRRPRRITPENLSDPGLLGAGEHGAGYRSRLRMSGPAPRLSISCVPNRGLPFPTD